MTSKERQDRSALRSCCRPRPCGWSLQLRGSGGRHGIPSPTGSTDRTRRPYRDTHPCGSCVFAISPVGTGSRSCGAVVALHLTRLVAGSAFLVYHRWGELPYAFAVPGGWGDITVAVGAAILLVTVNPKTRNGRRLYLLWNVLGLIDILGVVANAAVQAMSDPESMRAPELSAQPAADIPRADHHFQSCAVVCNSSRTAGETRLADKAMSLPPKRQSGSLSAPALLFAFIVGHCFISIIAPK